MKKTLLFLAALTLPLFSAAPALASVNPAVVSADAKWLVYADLNALRESVLGKELIALGEKDQLDTGAGKLGVDWQKLLATVGSATAYGANLSSDPKQMDGALVFQGTPNLRKIAEAVLIQANLAHPENVAELTNLPFPAYVVKEAGAKAAKSDKDGEQLRELAKTKGASATEPQEVIIAFPPEPIVLVSKSQAQILKARDVFRGAAPSLAKTAGAPLAKFLTASDGAYLFAASTVPADSFLPKNAENQGPEARIFKMASAGSLALGERGDNTFAHSELVASSDQMGEKLMKILQGMTAMMSLAETNDKQLAEFLNSAAVNRQGDVVTLDLAYSSARLATMIKTLQETKQSGPAEHPAPRAPQMTNGQAFAEWKAEPGPGSADGAPGPVVVRQIDGVALKNGTLITLARQSNGGRNVRFDRIEILPAGGAGMPLTFRPESMRSAGTRGNWQQFQFPGVDGTYTLKVAYLNDPEGKATFAVSAKDPKAPSADPQPKAK
jgi:hypothetical protein